MTVGIEALEAPMWFALPPEVHSTLLSTGAGPGPLLAAASAWRMLAAEYLAVETELTEILAAAQGTAWTGPTADRFAAAHQPFLLWLRQAAAVATVAATGHETTAAGYMSALAGMPTLAELAANHVVHGVLLATNFFGINTIPIAATEADYTRMWVQAATTMSAYGGVAEASLTSTPVTSPAPPIVSPAANAAADSSFPDPTKVIIQLLQNWLTRIGDLASQYLPGPLGSFVSQMLNSLVAFMSTQLFLIPAYSVLDTAIYFGPFLALLAPFAAIGLLGLIGLEGLDDSVSPVGESHSAMPGRQAQTFPISTGVTPAGNGAAASGTTAGTPTSSAATAGASAPAAGATHGFYAISSDPDGEGFSPTSAGKTAAAATAALAAPAAASLAARDQIRAKRRAQARQHGRKYEFAFVDDEADTATSTDPPDAEQTAASESGSDALGFAGTVPKTAAAQAQGLTRVSSAGLDEAAQEPMLPRTWEP
jgi:PPE-repeat protein